MSSGPRDILEHSQTEQQQQQEYHARDRLQEAIQAASAAIGHDDPQYHAYTARTLTERIVPCLRLLADHGLVDYGHHLTDDRWHWDDLQTATTHTQDLETSVHPGHRGSWSAPSARQVIRNALQTTVAIAEHEDYILADYANRVDVVGYSSVKIGEQLQRADMDLGNPVQITSLASGALKTLFCGGTGQGKSAGIETEAESIYETINEPGRDYKLIDLVGLRDGENWFYDIPQHDNSLAHHRSDMGLPESFTDSDEFSDRDVEIRAPLTEELADQLLPYNEDEGGFVVKPFTIPAADIEKPLLVSMIASKLTDSQEATVRSAYDECDRQHNDWSLRDLASVIKAKDELSDAKREHIVATLRDLQNQGFIRTREDDWTLDLRELYTTPETITVFTQSFVPGEIGRLIALGYLVYEVASGREQMHDVPECVAIMRELWKVAPHSQRQAFDSRAAALQEMIGQLLVKLFRENRHSGVHLLADTQQPSDLLKPVREMFNRYVVFETNKETVKDIYEWTANDDWQSFYRTLNETPGQASIVGMVQPAVDKSHIEYVGPVQYAPPSHHHRIEHEDTNGWRARTKYVEREELRRPSNTGAPWLPDRDVPQTLAIDDPTGGDAGAADPELQPVSAFADQCLVTGTDDAVKKSEVVTAFNEFVTAKTEREAWDFDEHSVMIRFGKRLSSALPDGFELDSVQRGGENAYKAMGLSETGREYHDRAFEDLEDSAAPLTRES